MERDGAPDTLADPALIAFIVLCRDLGCIDDTASEEEQYEKILYYYPEDTRIAAQLQRANLCEGLIDFSTRFSENEPLDTVTMKVSVYISPFISRLFSH